MKRAWIILLNCKKRLEKLEQNNRWVKRSCDWNRILPLCIVLGHRLPQPKASATVWPRLHIFVTLQCPVHVHVSYFCHLGNYFCCLAVSRACALFLSRETTCCGNLSPFGVAPQHDILPGADSTLFWSYGPSWHLPLMKKRQKGLFAS